MPWSKLPDFLRSREQQQPHEEGVHFSRNLAHPMWRVEVHFTTGQPPCRELVRAATAEQARTFVLNRYAFACPQRLRVLGQAQAGSAPNTPPSVAAPEVVEAEPVREEVSTRPAAAVAPAVTIASLGLQPLPRHPNGSAIISTEVIERAAAAHRNGMTWDKIADQLKCSSRHLRYRIAEWQKTNVTILPIPEKAGGQSCTAATVEVEAGSDGVAHVSVELTIVVKQPTTV
jgi:AraC-like DNA-binding protein